MKYRYLAASTALGALFAACSNDGPVSTPPLPPVKSVKIDPRFGSIHLNETLPLTATATDTSGAVITYRRVGWSVSDTSIASIDQNGLVRPRKVGREVVTASMGGVSDSIIVQVAAFGYSLAPDTNRILPGASRQLLATGLRNYDDSLFVLHGATWTSSDASVATVDSAGNVKALKPGSVTITARYVGESFTASVHVPNLPALRFAQVAVGGEHACGLTADGALYCWGSFQRTVTPAEPVDRCAVTTFVGHGAYYYLRDWVPCSASPARVATPEPLASIAIRGFATCGLSAGGTQYCWGFSYMLGTDTPGGPKIVGGGQTFRRTEPSCSITPSNEAWCWGSNVEGNLGVGNDTQHPVGPDAFGVVLGGGIWRQVSSGAGHRCGISIESVAYCWGSDVQGEDGQGRLPVFSPLNPNPINPHDNKPTPVKTDLRFNEIQAGFEETCGIATDGGIYCWGQLSHLPLEANGNPQASGVPVAVEPRGNFHSLSMDWLLGCAIGADGYAYCFGYRNFPMPIGLTERFGIKRDGPNVPVRAVAVSTMNACAIGTDGITYCWGDNTNGHLGDGDFRPTTAVMRVVGQ